MTDSIYRFSLDIHSTQSQVSISVPQYDTARVIMATLTEGGKPYQLSDECRAVFLATKADGTQLTNDCIILNGSVIRYDFTEQTTAAVGIVDCSIKVYGANEKVLTSPRLTLVVYEGTGGELLVSESESTILDGIMTAEVGRVEEEKERVTAEQERVTAEENRVNAEEARVSAEEARVSAEQVREERITEIEARITEKAEDVVGQAVATAITEITEDVEQAVATANVAKALAGQSHVTPQRFGAKGDGVTDDSAAIQAAFDSLVDGGMIYFPPGVYVVDSATNGSTSGNAVMIKEKHNITVNLDNAAVITTKFTGTDETAIVSLLYFRDCTGIEVVGGTFKGDKDEKIAAGADGDKLGAGGNGIALKSCKNVYIHNSVFENMWGDGIGISPNDYIGSSCENVLIENCTIDNCLRNGIAICGAIGCTVRNCNIDHISGAMPQAGIDIEAEWVWPTDEAKGRTAINDDIMIDGCTIGGSYQSVCKSANTHDVTIRNCVLKSPLTVAENAASAKQGVLKVYETVCESNVAVCGEVELHGCTTKSWIYVASITGDDGIVYRGNFKAFNSVIYRTSVGDGITAEGDASSMYFERCTIYYANANKNVFLHSCGTNYPSLELKKCVFHIESQGSADYQLFDITAWKPLIIDGCTFIAESEAMNQRFVGKLNAFEKCIFTNNLIDFSKVKRYEQGVIVAWQATTDCITVISGNVVVTNRELTSPICSNVFGCSGMYNNTHTYIINNIAPTFNGIATNPINEGAKTTVKNNVLSTTPEINDIQTEEWIFEREDGQTETKRVVLL